MSSGLVLLFRINRDFFNGSRRRSLVGHDLVKDLAQRLVPETLFELGSVREDVGTVQTRHGPLFVVRLHLDREVRGPGLPDPDQPKAGCPSVPTAGASGHSSARGARRGHGGHTRSSSPHRASRGRARLSGAARAILRASRGRSTRSRPVCLLVGIPVAGPADFSGRSRCMRSGNRFRGVASTRIDGHGRQTPSRLKRSPSGRLNPRPLGRHRRDGHEGGGVCGRRGPNDDVVRLGAAVGPRHPNVRR